MSDGGPVISVFIMGVLTVAALLVKAGLKRAGLPSLVGFLALGLLFRYLDNVCGICSETDIRVVEFLAKAGLVALLFRVGLESNLKGLLRQLRTASGVWGADVLVSGALGYATCRHLLGLAAIPSLVVATAFTATSVGITVVVWQEMNALKSRYGELLGFSMAIGAFFAGLIFSRDPDAVKMESAFMPVYDFLSPFFFIGIGLDMDPAALGAAVQPAAALALAAIGGKLIADGLPLWPMAGGKAAVLIGASMTPRAEITMAIMEKGHGLGEWAVPAGVYNAMVLVSATKCILGPLGVRMLLKRWHPAKRVEDKGTRRGQGVRPGTVKGDER